MPSDRALVVLAAPRQRAEAGRVVAAAVRPQLVEQVPPPGQRRLDPGGHQPVPLVPLSAAVGLGRGTGRNAPLIRSLARMVAFGLARVDPGDRLAVRRRWPPLTTARARRLPGWLAQDHDAAVRAAAEGARAARLDAAG